MRIKCVQSAYKVRTGKVLISACQSAHNKQMSSTSTFDTKWVLNFEFHQIKFHQGWRRSALCVRVWGRSSCSEGHLVHLESACKHFGSSRDKHRFKYVYDVDRHISAHLRGWPRNAPSADDHAIPWWLYQSATLTIPKRHFDRTKARFTSALKKDSSSLANSETQAPSKCVSKRLAVGTVQRLQTCNLCTLYKQQCAFPCVELTYKHHYILAARCYWFQGRCKDQVRPALLCEMLEDNKRKVPNLLYI